MIKILRSNNPHAQISKVRDPQLSSISFVPFLNKNSRAFISRRTGCEWCLLLRRDDEIPHAHPISVQDGPDITALQQDGANSCFHIAVGVAHLGLKFSTEMDWPPSSPDLTPLDFLFQGYIKEAVNVQLFSNTLPELRAKLLAAASTVTPQCLEMCGLNLHIDTTRARLLLCPHYTSVTC